jgi:protein-S-isoprenylcysteine O-methyltransferase Ste14
MSDTSRTSSRKRGCLKWVGVALGALALLLFAFLTLTWHIAGAVVLVLGLELSGWAMIANAFFSTAVRIQDDRGHAVCDTGPYRFVRHPGYVGFILHALGLAFLLGSLWALIASIAASAFVIIRMSFEDRLLQAELSGYPDCVQKVRYRLLPGVW